MKGVLDMDRPQSSQQRNQDRPKHENQSQSLEQIRKRNTILSRSASDNISSSYHMPPKASDQTGKCHGELPRSASDSALSSYHMHPEKLDKLHQILLDNWSQQDRNYEEKKEKLLRETLHDPSEWHLSSFEDIIDEHCKHMNERLLDYNIHN
jgi:hypothetical protein